MPISYFYSLSNIYMLRVLWLIFLAFPTYSLPYPLNNEYFQHVFYSGNKDSRLYMNFSCKGQNIVSVSLTRSLIFQEHPRYDIFDKDQVAYTSPQYTFFDDCHYQYRMPTDTSFEILRADSKEVIFAAGDLAYRGEGIEFTVHDKSKKWGLGQRFQEHFHVQDGSWTIWNRDKPWKIDYGKEVSEQTYGHQPVYLAKEDSTDKYHIALLRNTHGMLYTVHGNDIRFQVEGGQLHFLLFLGDIAPEPLLQHYHAFIGASHIPPFWSMGYHQCRWGYSSLNVLQEVVKKFNQHSLPIDTVWSDLDYMDRKMIFTVDQTQFPPKKMNQWLKNQSLNYIPLIDAGVSVHDTIGVNLGKSMDVFIKNGKGYYQGEVWPGTVHFIDYLHPKANAYIANQLQRLYSKINFSGVWLDMNQPSNFRGNEYSANEQYRIQKTEGMNMMTINIDLPHYTTKKQPLLHKEVHAYYGHLETVATYRFLEKYGRPFIITRSNSVGTGRYAGHWTGDNVANWQFLRLSISGNFLYQIYGMQMVGADICGFHLNTNEELCARWMQLGTLYPFARNHNQQKYVGQQPYAFGTLLLTTSYQALRTRYAMLKQLYAILIVKKGLGSFFRPLFFEFPTDKLTHVIQTVQTQFLLGTFIMSAPIVYEAKTQRDVYFPGQQEQWVQYSIDSKSGEVKFMKAYAGQTHETIKNTMQTAAPLFLRAGYILFTSEPAQRTTLFKKGLHLAAVLKNNTSKGFILSIDDYNQEKNVNRCIKDGCMMYFTLKENNSIHNLQWMFIGDSSIVKEISIESVKVYSQGKTIQYGTKIIIKNANGNIELKKQFDI